MWDSESDSGLGRCWKRRRGWAGQGRWERAKCGSGGWVGALARVTLAALLRLYIEAIDRRACAADVCARRWASEGRAKKKRATTNIVARWLGRCNVGFKSGFL